MAFLHVKDLSFIYASEKTPAIADINLEVQKGEFLLLCGPSGCGKTTLLRHLKPHLEPIGEKKGEVLFNGVVTSELTEKDAATRIGLIMQNPESQIVTDTVRHELAFGLECLGFEPAVMARRVAETVSYFGIEELYKKKMDELSGGEKQLVSIAAIMAMRPELLLLDEPASQLDPIAARSLYDILLRLNNELGITVILSEHRIEDVFSLVDRVAVMDDGQLICVANPKTTAAFMTENGDERISAMLPIPAKLYKDVSVLAQNNEAKTQEFDIDFLQTDDIPVTVREVKPWFESMAEKYLYINKAEDNAMGVKTQKAANFFCKNNETDLTNKKMSVINLKSISFRFDKNNDDIINNLSLQINKGEILSIVGGNGAGKTTLLRLICGIIKPYSGKIVLSDKDLKIAYLPQNPQSMFAFDSVLEDLLFVAGEISGAKQFLLSTGLISGKHNEVTQKLQNVIDRLGIESILEKHPYDISFGELQRAALGMLLLKTPDIILLDEPTKGIDTFTKKQTAELLRKVCIDGVTVVVVTHDVEFAAEYSNRCAMLFDGKILNTEQPEKFFSGNMCYTTVAHRIVGNVFPETVTCEEVKKKWIDCIKIN